VDEPATDNPALIAAKASIGSLKSSTTHHAETGWAVVPFSEIDIPMVPDIAIANLFTFNSWSIMVYR
jgi:hypothetical protein